MQFKELIPKTFKETLVLLGLLLISQLAGLFWTFFISAANSTWYEELTKPLLTPPSWLFGPAWVLLYVLIALAFFLVYKSPVFEKREKNALFALFFFQLLLNSLWTPLFFSLQAMAVAFAELLLLLLLTLFLLYVFYKKEKFIFSLWLPYVLWLAFALYLNAGFIYLN